MLADAGNGGSAAAQALTTHGPGGCAMSRAVGQLAWAALLRVCRLRPLVSRFSNSILRDHCLAATALCDWNDM